MSEENETVDDGKTKEIIVVPEIPPIYTPTYINLDWLRYRCHQNIDEFHDKQYGKTHNCSNGLSYTFKDNGKESNILLVAHLDTVQSAKTWRHEGDKVYVPQLDDRLGVHIILDILSQKQLGLKYDVLLTEGEETGNSTAKFFKSNKEYNFIVEIDRRDKDPVMYQYDHPTYRDLLKSYGFSVWSTGSFTDICHLEQFGVLGINFACAYYNNHSLDAYVNLRELDELMPKIIRFLTEQQNNKLPKMKKPAQKHYNTQNNYYRDYGYGQNSYYDVFDDNNDVEDYCTICIDANCNGLVNCALCESKYHNSHFIEKFGICYGCLAEYFGIPRNDLDILLNKDEDKTVLLLVSEYVMTVIGGKYIMQ